MRGLNGQEVIVLNDILARRVACVKMLHEARCREMHKAAAQENVLAILLHLKYNLIKWP